MQEQLRKEEEETVKARQEANERRGQIEEQQRQITEEARLVLEEQRAAKKKERDVLQRRRRLEEELREDADRYSAMVEVRGRSRSGRRVEKTPERRAETTLRGEDAAEPRFAADFHRAGCQSRDHR